MPKAALSAQGVLKMKAVAVDLKCRPCRHCMHCIREFVVAVQEEWVCNSTMVLTK